VLKIKQLTPDQWPLLKAVRLRALADAPEAFCTQLAEAAARTDAEWQENARRFTLLPPAVSYHALSGGIPCGMANCFVSKDDPQTAELTGFWVAPEQRGTGIGAALVAAVTDWAKSQNVATLQAWVVEDNHRAIRFYEKLGFLDTGQRQPHTPEPSKQILLLAHALILPAI